MSLTDNTLAAAKNVGTLSSPINISDVISGTDPVSYYKFTFPENSDLAGTVDWGVRSGTPPFLRLVVDFNGNGLVEDNERIRTLSAGADGSFFQSLDNIYENIDHSRTKARSPQTNGICKRFHRTMLEEFYRVAFCKMLYTRIEQLQNDVDDWIDRYNCNRPHSERYCYGKTPMQTFLDSKSLVDEKMLHL